MNRSSYFHPLIFTSALLTLAAQPGVAAMTTITGVQLNPTDHGLELVFDTQGGDASNIFTVSQGNTLRADITRAQLALPNGDRFTQANPAPGISRVTVVPLDANSVRVTIDGTNQAPRGEILSQADRVVLAVHNDAQATPAPTPVPEQIATVPGPAVPAPSQPALAQTPAPEVLVPNPEVTIDGVPARPTPVNAVPPFLPRAVAPPVGDIAVAESLTTFSSITLDTNQRIPRLLLRDAPAREVLALLARAANMNLVYVPAQTTERTQGQSQNSQPGTGDNTLVTLDIVNEPVEDVFNHVLRVTGLQANRVGRSIYVGPTLPIAAQNIVVRTLRLNQVDSAAASNFLVALGAESAISRERLVTNVNAVRVGEGDVAPELTQTETQEIETIESKRVEYEDGEPIFRGLKVVADERTNSVTLTGSAELVASATEQLTRLDVRRRQVAVNVRVVDVNLSSIDSFGTSFSFTTGSFNFGFDSGGTPSLPSGGNITINSGNFVFELLASIRSGNSKIITDPTLIIQENQEATVALTSDVPAGFVREETEDRDENGNAIIRSTSKVEREPAGLTLLIRVNRIDDNGFVSLSVAPTISAPIDQIVDPEGIPVTLLSRRSLNSGQIRVRDSQTLILSGIIQESERSSVTKVPILGDIPILGALFRSTSTDNRRQELIVLLTPQILDDSDQSVFGYSYTPSDQMQEVLDQGSR